MNSEMLRWAIGGRNALTGWSLVALFPLGGLLGTFWGLRNGLTLATWLPFVVGVHLLLVLPFLLGRHVMIRASAQGPRPWLGLAIFASLGGLRSLMLAMAIQPLGVTLPSGTVFDVVPNGVGSGIVIFGVVAVVVDGSRRNRAVVEQLAALDSAFERTRAFDEAELAALEATTITEITSMLEEELSQVKSEIGRDPEQVAARLHMLATDVARPLSHVLAEGSEWIPEAVDITVKLPRWERIEQTIADVRPAHPLIPVLLIELIALPTVISEPVGGAGFAASMMLLTGGIMYALGWVVWRFWPSGRTTAWRMIVLVALNAVVGMFAATSRTAIVEWHTGIYNPLWAAPFFLILTSMGVSLTVAIQARQRADQDRLAMTIARNAQLGARVRERTRRAQRRIAKLLHSNIQAELMASARIIAARSTESSTAASQQDEVAQELSRLTTAIHARLNPSVEPSVPAIERVLDLTALWDRVLDVTFDVASDVWAVLDDDPEALDAVIDVVAEGLTNAVRHGNGPRIVIEGVRDAGEVTVRLTSYGCLMQGSNTGLGSEILTEATSMWALEAEGDQVRLTTHIPYVTSRL